MSVNKIFKRIWFYILISFQILPIGIFLFYLYGFSTRTDSSGWMVEKDGECKVFTSYNHLNRNFEWSGDCLDGFAHGQGELIVFDGNRKYFRFEGTLTKGKSEGPGKLFFYLDGDTYEGTFKNHQLHGYGHFYNDDGDHYEGYFEKGLRSGKGTNWYEPENPKFKYVGDWKNNMKNGFGTIYYRNGTVKSGYFIDGVLQTQEDQPNLKKKFTPKNILITNDDGVEDMSRLLCLADAVSEFADMVVIAVSDQNRSSTSNIMEVAKKGSIKAKCLSIDSTKQIYVYSVQGYPADCVLFGALGVFHAQGKTIDLVISGINGGPNIGVEWFGSGTIGAARTAALAKIPAIAVSGIDEDKDNSANMLKICSWVAQLAQSPIVEAIQPFEYLTISIPEDLEKIQGVKVVNRAISFDNPPFYLEKEKKSKPVVGEELSFVLKPLDRSKVYRMPAEHDVYYYYQNYVVINPMSVDENRSMSKSMEELIPPFKN